MRILDGEPGVGYQIDFAQMGFIIYAETGLRRKVHALIFPRWISSSTQCGSTQPSWVGGF